ncbi:MAG: hypothetical protein M5R36_06335 [Deltaproteobacteria bacterium]|nr:hypothetical protein [Deltaproteobacteria bacterium]
MVEDQTPRIDASTLTIDDSSRKFLLAGAFVTAGCIIGLEVALFQVVMYVSSYLSANQVISIALLGLSIGSLAAFYLARRKSAALFVICSLLFAVSIVGDFFWFSIFRRSFRNTIISFSGRSFSAASPCR